MGSELVPFIRDIAIIVMAVVVVVLCVTLLTMLLKTYPKVRRATHNFESASAMVVDAASRVSGIVSLGSEFAGLIWGLFERFRTRGGEVAEDGNEDGNSAPR